MDARTGPSAITSTSSRESFTKVGHIEASAWRSVPDRRSRALLEP